MVRPRADNPRSSIANVRLTEEERLEMERTALDAGHKNLSEYLRALHQEKIKGTAAARQVVGQRPGEFAADQLRSFMKTKHGEAIWGDSRAWLFDKANKGSVDLIMTSPPFGLVRKKDYGNEDAARYCDWFRDFAEGFHRVLKDDGSLVIDIGGAWMPGRPTRSLYHFKLLVMLVEEYGFHLCQEHYWWNPAKLPTPAEWVNIRRVRVKDAVNCVWWLAKTPYPKASNRRVLQPYSKAMRSLLTNGYHARLRPSGHDISTKFQKDNGGSVPPNLLAIANTESNGTYQDYCRTNDIPIHPARFPSQLPEYFIRMLTDSGDLVLDPFAGSCVTGAVSEALERRWICCELSHDYLRGSAGRFSESGTSVVRDRPVTYEISSPCALSHLQAQAPLFGDGGERRPQIAKRAIPRHTDELKSEKLPKMSPAIVAPDI